MKEVPFAGEWRISMRGAPRGWERTREGLDIVEEKERWSIGGEGWRRRGWAEWKRRRSSKNEWKQGQGKGAGGALDLRAATLDNQELPPTYHKLTSAGARAPSQSIRVLAPDPENHDFQYEMWRNISCTYTNAHEMISDSRVCGPRPIYYTKHPTRKGEKLRHTLIQANITSTQAMPWHAYHIA